MTVWEASSLMNEWKVSKADPQYGQHGPGWLWPEPEVFIIG